MGVSICVDLAVIVVMGFAISCLAAETLDEADEHFQVNNAPTRQCRSGLLHNVGRERLRTRISVL